jgi:hypothetical protein
MSNPADSTSRPDNRRTRFLLSLLAITLLFSVYHLYLTGYGYFQATSKMTRHIVRFGSILLAWAIGEFAFRKNIPGWLLQVWRSLYAGVTLLLLLTGVYDWYAGGLPGGIRNMAITLNEFLLSPAPFVIIWLINRWSRAAGMGGNAAMDDVKKSGKFESWK